MLGLLLGNNTNPMVRLQLLFVGIHNPHWEDAQLLGLTMVGKGSWNMVSIRVEMTLMECAPVRYPSVE